LCRSAPRWPPAGGIAATFNAPVTGVFFGVEIIVREFSVDALFTVMLAAMIADIPFLGDKPFLSGFPPGIVLHHARNYLLVAGLAVIASTISRALSSGTIYTTKLLRRGTDIDRRKVKAWSCATLGRCSSATRSPRSPTSPRRCAPSGGW
jgi:H+/Cl- antiporter ClcA